MTDFEPIQRLIATVGKWDLSLPEGPVYKGPQAEFGLPFGICVSNIRFVEGEARVTVKMPNFKKENDTHARFLIGYTRHDADYLSVGIGGSKFSYAFYRFEGGIWQPIIMCGSADNIIPDKPYDLSVQIKGQRLVFKENNVTAFEHVLNSPPPQGQLGLFTWGPAAVEFSKFCVRQDRGTAFVIMQFADPYQGLYEEVIKPVAQSKPFQLRVYNVGEALGRIILHDIIRGLEEARVVIAEVTPANKNVFYELGYAHALKKDAILLVQKDKVGELPFDIKGYRCILYENTIVGKRHVQAELERHLASIVRPNDGDSIA
jgi:hypothetical protein